MALTKGKRFEVFNRDGFTCQYCGAKPPDVTLQVDHITPLAKGGTDDDINLITSCATCNNGKRTKRVTGSIPRPDAEAKTLELKQEAAEIKGYLKAKKERDAALAAAIDELSDVWLEYLTDDGYPKSIVFKRWLLRFSPDEVEGAIKCVSTRYHAGHINGGFGGLIRYVAGVMIHRREDESA